MRRIAMSLVMGGVLILAVFPSLTFASHLEGFDEVEVTNVSAHGSLVINIDYFVEQLYDPDLFTLTEIPPSRIWTTYQIACYQESGSLSDPFITQGEAGVWDKTTELIPKVPASGGVNIPTPPAERFEAQNCRPDTYVPEWYNMVVVINVVQVEIEGEVLTGLSNPWNDHPTFHENPSFVIIDPDDTGDDPPDTNGCDVTFSDVPCDFVFHGDVEWLAESGITKGCNPPDNTLFCPNDNVTRGQMAAFLVRGLDLPPRGYYDEYATYVDVSSTHVFFDEVGILGAEGITKGCSPPDNDYFCPSDFVTRGQMAAFLVRALGLPRSDVDQFTDDEGSVFEADIQALAASGFTRGCNPPANDRFCPNEPVTRGQMAAFLHRALAP